MATVTKGAADTGSPACSRGIGRISGMGCAALRCPSAMIGYPSLCCVAIAFCPHGAISILHPIDRTGLVARPSLDGAISCGLS
jgi:hypothetical protein